MSQSKKHKIDSITAIDDSTTTTDEKDMEQINFGPEFCRDLKVIYNNKCFNVHRCTLSQHSKYFETLLSSCKNETVIHLPIQYACDQKNTICTYEDLKSLLGIMYSNKSITYNEMFKDKDNDGTERIYYYNMISHWAHYLECSFIETTVKTHILTYIHKYDMAADYYNMLFCAETLHYDDIKNILIPKIGNTLLQYRNKEIFKDQYNKFWPLLSRKTIEEIYEVVLTRR